MFYSKENIGQIFWTIYASDMIATHFGYPDQVVIFCKIIAREE